MGRYLSIPVLGICAALSASLLPQAVDVLMALLGIVTPVFDNTRGQVSLVMLVVICWSLRADMRGSLVWAVAGGIALDLLTILPIGATSLALALLAFAVNSASRQLLRARMLFLLALTPLATLLLTAYSLLVLALLGYHYDILAVTRLTLIPSMLLNLLAVAPVYLVTGLLQRRLAGGMQAAQQRFSQQSAARL